MAPATVIVGDATYALATITLDQAEKILDASIPAQLQIRKLIIASLHNAGSSDWTEENIGGMAYATFAKLRQIALEINGLNPEGEAQAAATAQ